MPRNQDSHQINGVVDKADLRKLHTWEYARYTKMVLTSFLADLQSNFDCILPDMSSLFLMKKGMSKEAAYSRAATMASLQRGVRTAHGTPTETSQHDSGCPPLPGAKLQIPEIGSGPKSQESSENRIPTGIPIWFC